MSDSVFIVGYGSAISLGSVAQTDRSLAANPIIPVRVVGWERALMVPSRTWEGLVAGVRRGADGDEGFNATLIEVPSAEALAKMDAREALYDRVAVNPESVVPYFRGHGEDVLERARRVGIYLYVPKPDKISYEGEISWPYVRVCLSGAYSWGRAFAEEFLEFTFVGPPDTPNVLAVYQEELARHLRVPPRGI